MATHELTAANLESTINDNDMVIIDFWAPWCAPCKMFGPIFEKASEKYPDVKFMKCNTEVEQEVAGSFGIRSIPTTAIFREQALLFMQPGALPEAALHDVLGQVKALDMDEVRRKIAEHEKEGK
ncbi:MAG: thioredoxin [Deltaproteobacteria bacterium]|nr:thioredoxin [Deltaproteobacteria bacterium]